MALVVSKLFHLVQPHKAYFGQKDLQQYAIIRQLVTDLNFNLELVCYPIVREKDGLAMSSRNRRLTEKQRELAPQLYQALQLAEKMVKENARVEAIKSAVTNFLEPFSEIRLEYFEIADATTLQPVVDEVPGEKEIALCIAAFLGEIRLIDNLVITTG